MPLRRLERRQLHGRVTIAAADRARHAASCRHEQTVSGQAAGELPAEAAMLVLIAAQKRKPA